MHYAIRRLKDSFGSGYTELGAGPYEGRRWQPESVFVEEDDFAPAEPAIKKRFPSYEHWGDNDIPRSVGILIVRDWRAAAAALDRATPIPGLLPKPAWRESELVRVQVARLLWGLADACEGFIAARGSFCVLGP